MISKSIKNKIASFEMGKVFRLEDLGLPRAKQNAAVVALGRLVQEGEIERLSPGNYYKPKQTFAKTTSNICSSKKSKYNKS